MSKYDPLWEYVQRTGSASLLLTYSEIEHILGFPIDHSFLTFKKELLSYGYTVEKVSMKTQTVSFSKTK